MELKANVYFFIFLSWHRYSSVKLSFKGFFRIFTMTMPTDIPKRSPEQPHDVVQSILEALHGLRYGSVEIIVHDGRVVQIERREKVRLELSSPSR